MPRWSSLIVLMWKEQLIIEELATTVDGIQQATKDAESASLEIRNEPYEAIFQVTISEYEDTS